MAKPKFFEVTVKVPMRSIREAGEMIAEILDNEYDVHLTASAVLKREGVEAWIKTYLANSLKDIAKDLDLYDPVYDFTQEAEKFFRAEIQAARVELEKQEALDEARRREAEALRPASVVVMVSKGDIAEVRKQLKELGLTVL